MKNYITPFAIGTLVLALVMSPLVSFAKENGENGNSENKSSRTQSSVTVSSSKSNSENEDNEVEHAVRSTTAPTPRSEKNSENNKKSGNSDRNISTSTKSNSNESESENDSASNSKKNATFGKCLKAYGHLFAPGWVKNNGATDTDVSNCWLPFGINKRLHSDNPRGQNASTTPDVTAPVISGITAATGASTTTINWNTNERATSKVFYSSTNPVIIDSSTTPFVVNNALTLAHPLYITGLATSTSYYFVVRSVDAAGNVATSSQYVTITKGM